MVSSWLHITSMAALAIGLIYTTALAIDEVRHPAPGWTAVIAWPAAAVLAGAVLYWAYHP